MRTEKHADSAERLYKFFIYAVFYIISGIFKIDLCGKG